MNIHAVCDCGHELHRHGIFPEIICAGQPEFPEVIGECNCQGFQQTERRIYSGVQE